MNKACIMKLAWGLKTDPSRLCFKVLNGKYGQGTLESDIIQVKTPDSSLWKVISGCWQEINNSEAWSLGRGDNISFWNDKWINGSTRLKDLALVIPSHAVNWKVSDVVDSSGEWAVNQLHPLLQTSSISQILAHPEPLPHDGPDVRYWPGEGAGNFTVSLAYNQLRNDDTSLADEKWLKVWKLQVPEHIRSFVWQILHGKLATKEYCGKWGNGDIHCYKCYTIPESRMHVLRDCHFAKQLRDHLIPRHLRMGFYGCDEDEWIHLNLMNSNIIDVSLEWCNVWATGCYYLWTWRNKQVHDEDFSRPYFPSRVVLTAVHEYEEGKVLHDVIVERSRQHINVSWKPFGSGWLTVNTDGAVMASLNLAGCGGAVCDHQGRWLGGFAKRLYVSTAYLAELWGALEGLKFAATKGFTQIELQLDSRVVVQLLKDNRPGSVSGHQLVRRIKQLLANFSNVHINHVYREANRVADELADMGCSNENGLVTFDSPPPTVLSSVVADVLGVPTPRLILV